MKKENKSNSSNVHVVVNTKGGCGKSTCSSILATLLYLNNPNKKINLFELDDNNETKVDSKYIDSSSLTLKHTETVIDNINFNQLIDPDYISVLDSGGSNDSVMILNKLKEIDMVGNNFYIPINDDLEQFKNLFETVQFIRSFDCFAKITVILNRCITLEKKDVEKQFLVVFGSEELEIKNRLNHLKIDEVCFVPNAPILSILKNHYQISLLDFYLDSIDLVKNIDIYRLEWAKDGKEVFIANNKKYRIGKMAVELIENLEPIKKMLLKA